MYFPPNNRFSTRATLLHIRPMLPMLTNIGPRSNLTIPHAHTQKPMRVPFDYARYRVYLVEFGPVARVTLLLLHAHALQPI